MCSCQALQDFLSCDLALANRAVHMLIAFSSDIGTGIVHWARGLVLQVAPTAQSAKVVAGGVRPAGPLFSRHIGKIKSDSVHGFVTEICGQLGNDLLHTLFRGQRLPSFSMY